MSPLAPPYEGVSGRKAFGRGWSTDWFVPVIESKFPFRSAVPGKECWSVTFLLSTRIYLSLQMLCDSASVCFGHNNSAFVNSSSLDLQTPDLGPFHPPYLHSSLPTSPWPREKR